MTSFAKKLMGITMAVSVLTIAVYIAGGLILKMIEVFYAKI